MTDNDVGERFERLARAENQKGGWSIVVFAIAALVLAVVVLSFAYGRVQHDDNQRFTQFQQQLHDNKREIDNGASERERLNREIDALKGALNDHNVPIPAGAIDTGTTTTTLRGSPVTSSRAGTRDTTAPTSTTTTTRPTTTPSTSPPPSSTTTTQPPPQCTVPTLPGGRCLFP